MRLGIFCLAVLTACAAVRPALHRSRRTSSMASAPLELPPSLEGEPGRPVPLSASERTLSSAAGVSIARRAYGTTAVALASAQGLKEQHSPSTCLRAGGYEVILELSEETPVGCLTHLIVRRDTARSHFYYAVLDGDQVSCSAWRRTLAAAWAGLLGRSRTLTSVQVMDSEEKRARTAIGALLTALLRRKT